jgi:tRNA nucleotidyltransferase/poly(A) polymerase
MKNFFIKKLKEKLLKVGAKFYNDCVKFLENNKKFENEKEFLDLKLICNNGISFDTIFISDLANELKNKVNKMFDKLKEDEESIETFKILKKLSFNSYIVGGANRNALAGFEIKDYDFVTDANIDDIIEKFKKNGYKVDKIGQHFAVVMVSKNNKTWEIANFRKDLECNGKGATKVEIGSFDDDWKRRDFRFNAIYSDPLTYILKDPTNNGICDAINKEIYFIGDPDKRIDEDAIRLLRILKFYKEGFNIPKKTMTAFRRNFHKLCNADPERIREHIEYITFFERKENENNNEK